jgi:integrase/recombinase XerD
MIDLMNSSNQGLIDRSHQIHDELIDRFRKDCELRKFATSNSYALTVRRFCTWLEMRNMTAPTITKRDLKDYIYHLQQNKGLKFGTIRHNFIAINCLYSYLEEEELISSNPVPAFMKRYLSIYKNDSESESRQIISIDDAAMLVSSTLETRDRAIILLFLKTGMRLGELASLDVSDINLEDLSLTLKETAKRSNRHLYFDHETAKVLEHWLVIRALRKGNESSALFQSCHGVHLCTNQIHESVTKHAEIIGLHNPGSSKLADKFGPHCCRHWFTTHLLRAGMRREYVKWLRGDSIHEAVDIYYHIDPEDVRREYMMHIPQLGV